MYKTPLTQAPADALKTTEGMLRIRSSRINKNLVLHEPDGGIYYGTDALLLAHFIKARIRGTRERSAIDAGTGSGVISLLLLGSGLNLKITGIEIQPEYCSAARQNAEENGFADKLTITQGDIRDIKALYPAEKAEIFFTNPPYLGTGSGKPNEKEHKNAAFHEVFCGIGDICAAASYALKTGGSFYCVYRTERLTGLLCAMRENKIEPKRLTLVCPSEGLAPSLVLVEGKRGGKEGLIIQPALYIYSDKSHTAYTPCMSAIYEEFK